MPNNKYNHSCVYYTTNSMQDKYYIYSQLKMEFELQTKFYMDL